METWEEGFLRNTSLLTTENMTDIEVELEVQLSSSSEFVGLQEEMSDERKSDSPEESPLNTGPGEVEEPLSLLAIAALAPPCGFDCEVIQSLDLQLQFLLNKADDLQDCLANEQGHLEREALAAAVTSFLYTCQPYFNHLESTSTLSQHTPLPFNTYTRQRMQLLDFSQQLCDRLEQLVLTYASYNLLCLDETEPNSVSPFCIGQRHLGPLRLTAFRYCKPTPYLARVDTGLHKRMRWNVERLPDEQQTDEEREEEIVGDTEYYFLCYEDIPNAHAEAGGDCQSVSHGNVVRMWSIGQWVQVFPDTDDIYDWILCEVPRGSYHRLLFLGSEEPSSCSATDCMQQLLSSHQTE
ncbi:UPF0575 protein C19orf67 homolog isoform X1 [Sebastes umbrosus]|uniref:UPF0575 protein C19orf67 homolog isoform X1 n=2 Tax=Sebastes umbrosus TaxID=72105 RepID=UPI00189EE080|nr:UPF0575 protein C19orf67 homolog isoform X1 [Sebastes umbrosus]